MPNQGPRKRKSKEKDDKPIRRTGNIERNNDDGRRDRAAPESNRSSRQPQPALSISECCCRCLHVLKWVVLFLILPAVLNHASLYKEAEHLRPQGESIEVGLQDHKLFLSCMGEGKPTVVLDAPTGMSSDVWFLVQPRIAKFTRVCSYDRTGLGFSSSYPYKRSHIDPSDPSSQVPNVLSKGQESTTERMVDDLHSLLHSNNSYSKAPYIMVGSELGATNAMFYSQMFENEVSDMVLIDPLVEGLFDIDDGIWEQFWYGHVMPSLQSLQLSAAIGLTRLGLIFGLAEQPIRGELISDEVVARQKYLMCLPRHLKAAVDEHFYANQSLSQVRTAYSVKPFPQNVSVTVITGNYYDEELPSILNKAFAKATQKLISTIHPSAKHLLINGADHHMLYRNPNAIVEPIKKLVRHWRQRNSKTTTPVG